MRNSRFTKQGHGYSFQSVYEEQDYLKRFLSESCNSIEGNFVVVDFLYLYEVLQRRLHSTVLSINYATLQERYHGSPVGATLMKI